MKHDIREMRIEIHRGKNSAITGHTVHHHMMPKATRKSGAFMEETHHSFPFDAKGESSTHGNMLDHIGQHLNLSEPSESEHEGAEQEEEHDNE